MLSKVPYDNDSRPLQPANKNLKAVREHEGPSPTQDGPTRQSATPEGANDPFSYLDTSGEMWSYLEGFRSSDIKAGADRK